MRLRAHRPEAESARPAGVRRGRTGLPGPIAGDPDLASLAGEPRFQKLVAASQLAAEPCKDAQANPQYRQLDFWVGEWDVFSGKQKVGESSVQLILKDCVVFENWHGLQGGDGKSLNKYNNVTQAVGAVLGLGQRDDELLQRLAGGWSDALHARDARRRQAER